MRGCLGCLVPMLLYGLPMLALGCWLGGRGRVRTVERWRVVHDGSRLVVRRQAGGLVLSGPMVRPLISPLPQGVVQRPVDYGDSVRGVQNDR
jgi:hypothetical protein